MSDLTEVSYAFPDWSAVLDFLAKTREKKADIKEVHIVEGRAKEWTVKVNPNNKKNRHATPGAALYDLYW